MISTEVTAIVKIRPEEMGKEVTFDSIALSCSFLVFAIKISELQRTVHMDRLILDIGFNRNRKQCI